jgi:hypothetical protein
MGVLSGNDLIISLGSSVLGRDEVHAVQDLHGTIGRLQDYRWVLGPDRFH